MDKNKRNKKKSAPSISKTSQRVTAVKVRHMVTNHLTRNVKNMDKKIKMEKEEENKK